MADDAHETLLLLGEAHGVYDEVAARATRTGSAAGAITVGSRPDAPSRFGKVDPNEDGVLVADDGRCCLLAVADAHYGRYASHVLLGGLAATAPSEIVSPGALAGIVRGLGDPDADPDHPSETTLLVVVLDREAGEGFGLSYGDSTAAVLDPETGVRVLNEKTPRYVTPARPTSLRAHGAVRFPVRTRPGQLVVAFTDGVDECHYGRPKTSIRPRHLRALLGELGPAPEPFARRLLALALSGVDGHPGGEDNAAVAVART